MKLKKSLGQHLLVGRGILEALVNFVSPKEGEVLIEIGPGTGNLTKILLNCPLKKLILVEVDEEMIEHLKKELNDERIVFLKADARSLNYEEVCKFAGVKELKLVGNLPYYAASHILERAVHYHEFIREMFFMVQKEVAERLQSKESWLSVFVRTFYEVNYLTTIPPRFFLPPPKVYSAFVSFKRKKTFPRINTEVYKKLLTKAFSGKRKMLRKKLPEALLKRANICPEKRAHELEVKEFLRLYDAFCNEVST